MHIFSDTRVAPLHSQARKPGPSVLPRALRLLALDLARRHEATLVPLLAEPFGSATSKDLHDAGALAGSGEVHRRARRVAAADRVDVRAALDLSEPK